MIFVDSHTYSDAGSWSAAHEMNSGKDQKEFVQIGTHALTKTAVLLDVPNFLRTRKR